MGRRRVEAEGRCDMSLENLMREVASTYLQLAEAALPGRTGEPSDTSPDPRNRPAPGRLPVMEHRHKLLRGLRWWVDAVRDPEEQTRVGESVPHMCAWLLAHEGDLAPEDREEMTKNLNDWVSKAWGLVGPLEQLAVELPAGAEDQVVPVHVAAQVLGVSVSTVKRRAPRVGGMVRLGDAMRCDHWLPHGQCALCA